MYEVLLSLFLSMLFVLVWGIDKSNMRIYGGWIKGTSSQKTRLRFLGVKGKMIYNKEMKCFERCECTIIDLVMLRLFYWEFWGGCWTAYDSTTGKNLISEYQLDFNKWDK